MVCSAGCGAKYAQGLREKKDKQWVKETKAKLMTHGEWLKMLQVVFNIFIRLRDKDLPCISCGTTANVEYAAGHFYPTTYSALRFNEDNVHKQCNKNCNMMKRGNLHEYRVALEKKISPDRLRRLDEIKHLEMKMSIPEIKEKLAYYRSQIKLLRNGTKTLQGMPAGHDSTLAKDCPPSSDMPTLFG